MVFACSIITNSATIPWLFSQPWSLQRPRPGEAGDRAQYSTVQAARGTVHSTLYSTVHQPASDIRRRAAHRDQGDTISFSEMRTQWGLTSSDHTWGTSDVVTRPQQWPSPAHTRHGSPGQALRAGGRLRDQREARHQGAPHVGLREPRQARPRQREQGLRHRLPQGECALDQGDSSLFCVEKVPEYKEAIRYHVNSQMKS